MSDRFRLKADFANTLDPYQECRRIAHGAAIDFETEKMRIEFIRDDLVRIKISQGGVFEDSPSSAIVDSTPRIRKFSYDDSKKQLELSSRSLKVCVDKKPFNIRVYRQDGSQILSGLQGEKPGETPYLSLNNNFAFRFKHRADDLILGLGEKSGPLNRAGRKYQLWNCDLFAPTTQEQVLSHPKDSPLRDARHTEFDPYYISIPFIYMVSGEAPHNASGLFFDNPHRAYFDFDNEDYAHCEFSGGQLTLYVFAGPMMQDILKSYTELTGRISIPPLWSLGHHHCRWTVYKEADVKRIAAEYRKRKIPCDSFWLDIDYMDGFRLFTWDKTRFPDPKKLSDELAKDGFRLVTIVDPGVKRDLAYKVCKEGLDNNHFCKTQSGVPFVGKVWPGQTLFPDFSKEDTRKWWARLNADHARNAGLSGIWNDMNEPAIIDGSDYDDMRFDRDGKNCDHGRFHNEYAMLMAAGTMAGMEAAHPNKRPFILSRGGSPGIQRYAANWLGDNCSRFEHIAMSIPMACGLGLSGQPFIGADVGGFAETCNPELLARWMLYASLTPFCRNHNSSKKGQEPWEMGQAVENVYRKALELRYRLLPYIYTAFVISSESGMPVQAPLAYHFQDDYICYSTDDQYMFGRDLLVAPVCAKGVVSRQVYLPKGNWYDFRDDSIHAGESYLVSPAPMNSIPSFVKEGSIIPMLPQVVQHSAHWNPELIELHLYVPLSDGEFSSRLWEDDGDSMAYKNGKYLDNFLTLSRSGSEIRIKSELSGEGFPQFSRKGFKMVFHGPQEGLQIFWNSKPCASGQIVG